MQGILTESVTMFYRLPFRLRGSSEFSFSSPTFKTNTMFAHYTSARTVFTHSVEGTCFRAARSSRHGARSVGVATSGKVVARAAPSSLLSNNSCAVSSGRKYGVRWWRRKKMRRQQAEHGDEDCASSPVSEGPGEERGLEGPAEVVLCLYSEKNVCDFE